MDYAITATVTKTNPKYSYSFTTQIPSFILRNMVDAGQAYATARHILTAGETPDSLTLVAFSIDVQPI